MKATMTSLKNTVDFNRLRDDFPIMQQQNRGKPLIYLDSAASAQKPQQVVEAIAQFYRQDYANIHRGIYELSERASELYEAVREKVKQFVRAPQAQEIIFTRNTTEGINLVAQSFGRPYWQAGDEVIISVMEHHANIVPWYLLQKQIGISLKVVPIQADGSLDLSAYEKLITPRTKLVALTHVSNALGIINPIKHIIEIAHGINVPVLVDGAQAVSHMPVDLSDLDPDFYVFSGHKLYGPTGSGVLYAKQKWLDKMPPYQGGGGMIETVSFDHITFAKSPQKFEAGTPDLASVIGLGAAIDYVTAIGMDAIFAHEQTLLRYALKQLATIPGLRIIGEAEPKVGVISFVMETIHPHDLGTVLDHEGIAIRAGHHCAMPLMERFNVPATVRVSFGLYNNEQEVDALVGAILLAKRLLS